MFKYFKNTTITFITLILLTSASFSVAGNYKIIFKNKMLSDSFNDISNESSGSQYIYTASPDGTVKKSISMAMRSGLFLGRQLG